MRKRWLFACLLCVGFSAIGLGAGEPRLPATPKKPVEDVYHGVKVVDPYRWLEDADDPGVRKWVAAQNRFSRAYLDKLPGRKALYDRLDKLNDIKGTPYDHLTFQDGKLFAQSDALLVTLDSADEPDSEKTLVDPAEVTGKKTAIVDFFQVAPDNKKVAVSISSEGREIGALYLFDVATGKKLPDVIANVKSPLGGSMVWKGDSSGFYYTRNPPLASPKKAGDAPKEAVQDRQLIFFHPLGKHPGKDTYFFGKGLPVLADTTLNMSPDDKYVLASVTTGWADDQFAHYLIAADGKVKQIGTSADKITAVNFGSDDDLYLHCWKQAPRGKIVRLPIASLKLNDASTIVPESQAVIQNFLLTEKLLLVQDRVDGAARIRVFDLKGRARKPAPLPAGSHVGDIVPLDEDRVLLSIQSYLTPPAWHQWDLKRNRLRRTKLGTTYPNADFSAYEVVREQATSKDGSKVWLDIFCRKGMKLDGRRPTWLTGYGGYGLTLNPEFEVNRLAWLEKGGVMAIAHLRGDGDFGEEWHRAGIVTKRQNAFDDFAACAQHLIARQYTSPAHLSIEGASNAGLLVGAVMTQHPKLFRAVVAQVGIYDMLRHERHGRGFDIPEFGSVKNLDEFKAMHAYSPYHHVVDGTAYPAVFIITGENDGRCDPTDSWKMAARLQAATSSKRPVLLWTSRDTGHQLSAAEALSQRADIYAFLLHEEVKQAKIGEVK